MDGPRTGMPSSSSARFGGPDVAHRGRGAAQVDDAHAKIRRSNGATPLFLCDDTDSFSDSVPLLVLTATHRFAVGLQRPGDMLFCEDTMKIATCFGICVLASAAMYGCSGGSSGTGPFTSNSGTSSVGETTGSASGSASGSS